MIKNGYSIIYNIKYKKNIIFLQITLKQTTRSLGRFHANCRRLPDSSGSYKHPCFKPPDTSGKDKHYCFTLPERLGRFPTMFW